MFSRRAVARFARDPEVKTSCVRIHYEEGYHVDMPVYRIVIDGADKLRDGAKINLRAGAGASPGPDATKAAGQNNGLEKQDKAGGGGKKRRPDDGSKQ